MLWSYRCRSSCGFACDWTRSRYAVYVCGKIDHIERTHVPEIRNDFNRAEAARVTAEDELLGLDVRQASEIDDP